MTTIRPSSPPVCVLCGSSVRGPFCGGCGTKVCVNCGSTVSGNYCGACGASTTIVASPPTVVEEAHPVSDHTPPVNLEPVRRRDLKVETWCVMFAFLSPVLISALVSLQQSSQGDSSTRFPSLFTNNFTNLIAGIISYVPVLASVPIALLLLSRTGQSKEDLGLTAKSFNANIPWAILLALGAFGLEAVTLIPFTPLLKHHTAGFYTVSTGSYPKYYIIEGICMAAMTAVSEEVLVNGYLQTRLFQLGWGQRASFILSMVIRTSYHAYYGWGFLLTIPFGLVVTRSFQKHHKLSRPILAHFIYDAVLFAIVTL